MATSATTAPWPLADKTGKLSWTEEYHIEDYPQIGKRVYPSALALGIVDYLRRDDFVWDGFK